MANHIFLVGIWTVTKNFVIELQLVFATIKLNFLQKFSWQPDKPTSIICISARVHAKRGKCEYANEYEKNIYTFAKHYI